MTTTTETPAELEEFRLRARDWFAKNAKRIDAVGDGDLRRDADLCSRWKHRKQLRLRKLCERGRCSDQGRGGNKRKSASHGNSHHGRREKSEAQKMAEERGQGNELD